jgi:hypothetical protein
VIDSAKPAHPANAGHSDRPVTLFADRLTVPLWWWPIAFAVLAPVAVEGHMALRGLPIWLAYLILSPLPAWALLSLGRHRVEVVGPADGADPERVELRVGRAHLPSNFVSRTAAIPPSAKSAALGRQLDPAAYVSHRPWVGPMVLLVLDDPDDPTPYWLVSTREPERLLAALGRPRA